jgi:hypothetical protein
MRDPAQVATHEAGHVVLGHLLGLRVERVVLHDEHGGTTIFSARPPVRTALVVLAAGAAAESVYPAAQLPAGWWALT